LNNIQLKDITKCTLEQQKDVLKIRNQEFIREVMYTDHEISINEHFEWIDKLTRNKAQKFLWFLKKTKY